MYRQLSHISLNVFVVGDSEIHCISAIEHYKEYGEFGRSMFTAFVEPMLDGKWKIFEHCENEIEAVSSLYRLKRIAKDGRMAFHAD